MPNITGDNLTFNIDGIQDNPDQFMIYARNFCSTK